MTGSPCDAEGNFLPENTPAPPREPQPNDDWSPYESRIEFELADTLFTRAQSSNTVINEILEIWAADKLKHNANAPFGNNKDLQAHIDATILGDVPWQSFNVSYNGDVPDDNASAWMTSKYDVWYRDPREVVRNLLSNPDFDGKFDYSPYREFRDGKRQWTDFMSGNWAWNQAVSSYLSICGSFSLKSQDIISTTDDSTHGSTFVPVILGSDKTTVSIATGDNEFYPLYLSIGNVRNDIRRAHQNAVVLIGFLAIPKGPYSLFSCSLINYSQILLGSREDDDSLKFRRFRRQLFHRSLSLILKSLLPGMSTPEVARCPDNHFRRVIYGLGPYIADYPEQALLACVVQNWCPKYVTHVLFLL